MTRCVVRFLQRSIICVLLAELLCSTSVHAQSSGFIYQGRLNDNGAPANGTYDLQFTLYDAVSNGNAASLSQTNSQVAVSNGLFAVRLDFGATAFDGSGRWLDIGVRTNGDTEPYTSLVPRQFLSSTPYAIRAINAGSAATANSIAATNINGTISLAQLPGVVVTNGARGVSVSG